jgi:ribonuclease PH
MLSKTVVPALKPSATPASSSSAPNVAFRCGWGNTSPVIGSAYVELGCSKVIAYAYAPRPSTGKNVNYDEGELECKVTFASHLTMGNGGGYSATGGNRGGDIYDNVHDRITIRDASTSATEQAQLERLLSVAVIDAFKPAIRFPSYKKTVLGLTIVIMQSSVQDLSAAINAASLAFSDASIELRDLVTSYTVEQEIEGKDILPFYCTVASMCNTPDCTLIQTSGTRTPEMLLATIALTTQQCKVVREKMSAYIRESYAETLNNNK